MVVSTRRTIHQNPELSFREEKTAKLVSEVLRSLDVRVKTKVGGNGVLGFLEGAKPGRVVALRAVMDALPLDEMSDVDFRSKVKGVMHACGHDAHVAMLLGAAQLLAKHRNEHHGTVEFLFQPAQAAGAPGGGAHPRIADAAMKNA